MSSPHFVRPRAFAEVDTAAIAANFAALRAYCKKSPIAVVKANAYGHGAALVVPALWAAGCRFFAVATAQEALAVRALVPDAKLLVLGYTPPHECRLLAEAKIAQSVFSLPYARALAQDSLPLCVHIKIDVGMCRLGFACEELDGIGQLFSIKNLTVTGLFTHFPCADSDAELTRWQLARFLALRRALPPVRLVHAAASAAALTLPEAVLDAPRPGLALYGISPVESSLALRPALRLCAPLVQIRTVKAGTAVGYGGDFVARSDTRIGVLPCGYADGLRRSLQGMPVYLRHNGCEFPVSLCGRICMDQCMVDLGNAPACVGDTVCLWRDVRDVAARAATIPYEILSNVSPRVLRCTAEERTC